MQHDLFGVFATFGVGKRALAGLLRVEDLSILHARIEGCWRLVLSESTKCDYGVKALVRQSRLCDDLTSLRELASVSLTDDNAAAFRDELAALRSFLQTEPLDATSPCHQ